jgi:hypothetical protein
MSFTNHSSIGIAQAMFDDEQNAVQPLPQPSSFSEATVDPHQVFPQKSSGFASDFHPTGLALVSCTS